VSIEALIDIEQNIQGTNFSPFNRQARDDPTETIDWETVAVASSEAVNDVIRANRYGRIDGEGRRMRVPN